jgi:hypothetical protein
LYAVEVSLAAKYDCPLSRKFTIYAHHHHLHFLIEILQTSLMTGLDIQNLDGPAHPKQAPPSPINTYKLKD